MLNNTDKEFVNPVIREAGYNPYDYRHIKVSRKATAYDWTVDHKAKVFIEWTDDELAYDA